MAVKKISRIEEKELKESIPDHVKAFRDSGGQIQHIPIGVSGENIAKKPSTNPRGSKGVSTKRARRHLRL